MQARVEIINSDALTSEFVAVLGLFEGEAI